MRIFISYSRRDRERVDQLVRDLESFQHDVWRDTAELRGGDEWWSDICAAIRERDLVIVAASPTCLQSRYCEAEIRYAHATGRTLLPVMVAPANMETGPEPLRALQAVPYVDPDGRQTIVDLAAALLNVPPSPPLPDPLPPVPDTPFTVPAGLRERIMAPALTQIEQEAIVVELRRLWDMADDLAVDLVREMGKRDLFESVRRDVEEMLDGYDDGAGASMRAQAREFVDMVMAQVDNDLPVTPIIGLGVLEPFVGGRRQLARVLAEKAGFPLAAHLRDDLPQVAQFVALSGDATVKTDVRNYIASRLQGRLGLPITTVRPGGLDPLFTDAWDALDPNVPDVHRMLAELPCAVYLTADPSQLLEHALRAAGREPVTEVCRWRRPVAADEEEPTWPPTNFGPDSTYEPSVAQPLVFHVFGAFAWPDTLVVTEDDYFEFLIEISRERETRVPPAVRSALARSGLFVLGFRLDDWDFRAIWQALVNQEGRTRSKKYTHVAVQVDLRDTAARPNEARKYLDAYFGQQLRPLALYWGAATDVAAAAVGTKSTA